MALLPVELINQRASRIRENQRRCRERKIQYIHSLEERIRKYERKCMKADLELQQRAQILKLENAKLKKILLNSTGIDDESLEKDPESLMQEIKQKLEPQAHANIMASNGQGYATFNQGVDLSRADPIQLTADSKAPSQPPDNRQNEFPESFVLALNHDSTFTGPFADQLWPALSLSPAAEAPSTGTVQCKITYDLLKRLMDSQNPTALQRAEFELKDGVLVGRDGSRMTLAMLAKILEGLKCRDCEY